MTWAAIRSDEFGFRAVMAVPNRVERMHRIVDGWRIQPVDALALCDDHLDSHYGHDKHFSLLAGTQVNLYDTVLFLPLPYPF